MSTTTANLGLFKYNTTTDANVAFNINTALNANWDKIDAAISNTGGTRNIGEIVASTIPLTDAGLHLLDGSLIQGDGIYSDFVNYISTTYNNSQYLYTNVNIVGSLSDTNGVLSDFSTSNYAWIPNVKSTDNEDIIIDFTTGSDVSTSQRVLHAEKYCCLEISGSEGIYTYKWVDNTIVNLISCSANTHYRFKININGTTKTFSYNTDGSDTFTTITSFTDSGIDVNANYQFRLGLASQENSYPFLGTINLNNSYITKNGSYIWCGRAKSGFCLETEWQNLINSYGVCGKFVYNSTNNTVRLPKITGILEGTTDVNALGDLIEAGLPNITGYGTGNVIPNSEEATYYGALYKYTSGGSFGNTQSSGYNRYNIGFDASRSNSIYGNSTTVQPQTIKVLYYIVIATSTKTAIQVDIDNIVNEWNNRYRYDSNTQTLYIGIDS